MDGTPLGGVNVRLYRKSPQGKRFFCDLARCGGRGGELSGRDVVELGRSFNGQGIVAVVKTEFAASENLCSEQSLLSNSKNFAFALDTVPNNREEVDIGADL